MPNNTDPYKEVWDSVVKHESDLEQAAHNGTLFEPSYEIMAQRHESTCRHLLRKARALGPGREAEEVFEEAMVSYRLAENMYAMRDKVLANSR